MESLLATLPFLAHFLIGFYFAFFGLWNIYHWFTILELMAKRGIPHPYLFLSIGIVWQVVAGVMIMFNIYIKLAAFTLIPFTIFAVCFLHPFWRCQTEQRKHDLIMFITNITVTLGALLLLVSPISQLADLFT